MADAIADWSDHKRLRLLQRSSSGVLGPQPSIVAASGSRNSSEHRRSALELSPFHVYMPLAASGSLLTTERCTDGSGATSPLRALAAIACSKDYSPRRIVKRCLREPPLFIYDSESTSPPNAQLVRPGVCVVSFRRMAALHSPSTNFRLI